MLIKRRNSTQFDAFSGVGYNHSLFEVKGGKLILVSGIGLSPEDYKTLLLEVRK